MLTTWKESYDQPRQHIQKQRHYFANKCPSSQAYSFSSGHIWIWELDYNESWVPKIWCFWTVVWRSNQFNLKEISPGVHWKDWCWSWNYNTLVTWCKELTYWKRPWCWERLEVGERDNRMRWLDGITHSMERVWASFRSWWWTGKPGVLQSMGLQRVGQDWATELRSPPQNHFLCLPLIPVFFLGSFFRPPTVQPSFYLHLLSKILYIFFHLFTHKCLFLSYFKGGNYYHGIFPLTERLRKD